MADPLLLHFEEKPRAIVAAMDGLRLRSREAREAARGAWKGPLLLVASGVAIGLLDLTLGFGSRVFLFAGFGVVVLGLWTAFRVRRSGEQPKYSQDGFRATRKIVHTLRDDVAPKRNMHGTLDLTGYMQASKKARSKKNARGRTVSYYRDDWLTVKTKLYDGSMLRFSVIRRVKVRDSYTKRGRASGRIKTKAAVVKSDTHRVDIRVTANPELYTVPAHTTPTVGQVVGKCAVADVAVEGSQLRVVASRNGRPSADEVLQLLLLSYATLQRRDAA